MRILPALCLELAGLALLAGVVILIAAFHVFGGYGQVSASDALIFSAVAVTLSTLGLIAYAVVRIGRLTAQNRDLQKAATRDGLTRLLNRSAFTREAERMIASLGRRREDPVRLTLLVVDADHFKRINDRLGHGVGDKALVAIAQALAGGLRHYDLVGRLGGEEFVVLLKDAGPVEAAIVAERLRANINRLSVGPASGPARLSVSLGGFCFDRTLPFDFAYKQADLNLYKAKKNGRNRAEISDLSSALRPGAPTKRLSSWDGTRAPRREGSTAARP